MKRSSLLNGVGILFLACILAVSPAGAQEQQESTQDNRAKPPVIDREVFNSQLRLDPVEIEAAPYQQINDIVLSQVGVNRTHPHSSEIQFRGTGIDGTVFIVDGISQGSSHLNMPDYSINLDAIEDIEIQTSGFTAEYGNVRSGVINIRTKGDDAPPALLNIDDEELRHVARSFVSITQLRMSFDSGTITADELEEKAVEAITSEGITLERYSEVLAAAENNSRLERRLLEAAREVAGQ